MRANPILLALSVTIFPALTRAQGAPLVVHEWGTFTCLMDDDGRTIGGVNTEDEPLPDFVHRPLCERMIGGLLLGPGDLAPCFFQGAPACHPDVTMRLETPVLYFHLPAGAAPVTLDVEVAWRGGWLSEFFPKGEATLPGMEIGPIGKLEAQSTGTLVWKGVQVGGTAKATPPATDAPVWLSPRRVASAHVQVGDEAEHFLFYRGVGNVAPPLMVVREADGELLAFRAPVAGDAGAAPTGPGWLLHVDQDHGCAFRPLPPLALDGKTGGGVLARTQAHFAPKEHAPANLARLRAAMQQALVADGLFADEADALLATWQVSYFQSPGLRVFYLVPQAWTDRVMPLQLSVPAKVARVMVARIELVEEAQRQGLARIAKGPASDNQWFNDFTMTMAKEPQRFAKLWGDLSTRPGALLAIDGLMLPDDYRAWLLLGRFRHALVLEELRRRPTDAMAAFVRNYGLGN